MAFRKPNPRTQVGYTRSLESFARFPGHPPQTASAANLRRIQLPLVGSGVSSTTIADLSFRFNVTQDKPEVLKMMGPVYQPRRLPIVLMPDDVRRLVDATSCLN